MHFINCLLDVADELLSGGFPREGVSVSITTQACLLAGLDVDEVGGLEAD